ncbi:MAG: hypothetical protein Q4C09_07715 [Atopobiaceae bacterium]|nr:hypothetical protein [Atopobiaceae bacterium]
MAKEGSTDALGRAMYALIFLRDGVTARELGVERRSVNRRFTTAWLLSSSDEDQGVLI